MHIRSLGHGPDLGPGAILVWRLGKRPPGFSAGLEPGVHQALSGSAYRSRADLHIRETNLPMGL